MMTLRLFQRRASAMTLLAAVTLLAACGTSTGTGAKATPTIGGTATPTAIPPVIYSADWTNKAADWKLTQGWSIKDGALLNDGAGVAPIAVPFPVTMNDYEIDLDAQEISATKPQNFGNLFGVVGVDAEDNVLFEMQILFIGNQTIAPAEWELTANGGAYAAADYKLNNASKTYRLQIHGRGIRMFINSPTGVAGVEGQLPLAPVSLRLESQHIQLSITRFSILQLQPVKS